MTRGVRRRTERGITSGQQVGAAVEAGSNFARDFPGRYRLTADRYVRREPVWRLSNAPAIASIPRVPMLVVVFVVLTVVLRPMAAVGLDFGEFGLFSGNLSASQIFVFAVVYLTIHFSFAKG